MTSEFRARMAALPVFDTGMNHGLVTCGERAYPSELKAGDLVQYDRGTVPLFVEVASAEVLEPEIAAAVPPVRLTFAGDAFGVLAGSHLDFRGQLKVDGKTGRVEWDTYFWRVREEDTNGPGS